MVREPVESRVRLRAAALFGTGLSRISLSPGDVSAIFFCSKNYGPLLSRLEDVERTTRNLFFHFTITANRELEFHTPDSEEAVKDYLYLVRRYSPDHIVWRYDPVCITDKLSFETAPGPLHPPGRSAQGFRQPVHRQFCPSLQESADQFHEIYRSPDDPALSVEQQREYAGMLSDRAEQFGIRLFACCNDHLLSERIGKASCIDGRYLSGLFNLPLDIRKGATRKECGCTRSADIGAYNTCAHGCVYCYANADKDKACANRARHHPDWNSLKMNVDEEHKASGRKKKKSSLRCSFSDDSKRTGKIVRYSPAQSACPLTGFTDPAIRAKTCPGIF